MARKDTPDEVAQQEVIPDESAPEEGLVRIWKHGESLWVHPTCVEAHKNQGWKSV
ncbi:MAG: hypothetical protein HQK81_12340 [Desulfovibrionaceae bacterium]|nr:hypothetical protein [Desulfovibrionaceae bacterium]MBF0514832.1 hypothetical protein [Desulfovibrionaceae bacterium]